MQIPFTTYQFADPFWLLLLLLVPVFYLWYKKLIVARQKSYQVSTTLGLKNVKPSWRVQLYKWMPALYAWVFFFFVIALARPQNTEVGSPDYSQGIDIMLSLDISTSMNERDLQPSRLEAAKEVAIDFVQGRMADKIGLVIFAGESFTQVPATTDHNELIRQLDGLHSGLLNNGTAIGMGLASAVNNLRHSNGKSKVAILMTDGINESNGVGPETAMELAKIYKVKVYTIGVGAYTENAYIPIMDEFGNVISQKQVNTSINEDLLKNIAQTTGGKYYRATDNASLYKIYSDIDRLEKSKIEQENLTQYDDHFSTFILLGLMGLITLLVLQFTVLKSVF